MVDQAKQATAAPAESLPEKNVRILVVEDTVLNQQITLKQLQTLGYSAQVVSNGLAALAELQRIPYDIVLMDCQMPEMDGYETTWQIRNREKEQAQRSDVKSKVYIIALTANTQPQDREKCLASGMDDYISKPVELVELDVALRRGRPGARGAEGSAGIIDPIVLAGLRHLRKPNQPDPLGELIDIFLEDAPARFLALEKSITQRDMSAALLAASSLKGSASYLGARRLEALCADIEDRARAGILSEAVPLLEQAKDEFARVQAALEREKKNFV